MVRHYVRKTKKGDSYSKNDLCLAKEAVQSKQMTVSSAAKLLNIPRPTLYDHINGRRGIKSNTMGRNTALGPQLEQKLANLIKTMDKYGHGLSRKEVLDLVGKYINANEIVSPFKNGYPNQDWWLGFSYRHKLSLKKTQVVECSRKKACNPFTIYGYFELLRKTMDELNIMDKPDRIWNLDETSFCLDPSKPKSQFIFVITFSQ